MSAPPVRTFVGGAGWLYSTRVQVVAYSLLLIATPFVLLRRFMQEAIGRASRAQFELAGVGVPIALVLGAAVVVVGVLALRRHITPLRLLAVGVAVAMNLLAQQFIDYYFDHRFYDLQQNWHYIAYALFALLVYRDLAPRGYGLSRIILTTYVAALAFSTFDETCQIYISGRAFEMNDIAKDGWGALMGVVVFYIGGTPAAELRRHWTQLRRPTLRGYYDNPASLLVTLALFNILLLVCAALLTERRFWLHTLVIAAVVFSVLFAAFHFSRRRAARWGMLGAVTLAVTAQGYFFWRHRADHIVYHRPGLTVYKGVPIVYFDLLIFPDGTFRPVDKLEYFDRRTQRFFLQRQPDILLIGSGTAGRGGRGFPAQTASQFIYNWYAARPMQVIILDSPAACACFNRLKDEGKNVMFVLHNTG